MARKKKITTFIPKGVTPYDNGKVKIGLNYQKPMYVEHDPDMLELQKWMIGDPEKLRREYWFNVAYILILCFVLIVIILRGST
jgi:hypothetical protein